MKAITSESESSWCYLKHFKLFCTKGLICSTITQFIHEPTIGFWSYSDFASEKAVFLSFDLPNLFHSISSD